MVSKTSRTLSPRGTGRRTPRFGAYEVLVVGGSTSRPPCTVVECVSSASGTKRSTY